MKTIRIHICRPLDTMAILCVTDGQIWPNIRSAWAAWQYLLHEPTLVLHCLPVSPLVYWFVDWYIKPVVYQLICAFGNAHVCVHLITCVSRSTCLWAGACMSTYAVVCVRTCVCMWMGAYTHWEHTPSGVGSKLTASMCAVLTNSMMFHHVMHERTPCTGFAFTPIALNSFGGIDIDWYSAFERHLSRVC